MASASDLSRAITPAPASASDLSPATSPSRALASVVRRATSALRTAVSVFRAAASSLDEAASFLAAPRPLVLERGVEAVALALDLRRPALQLAEPLRGGRAEGVALPRG